MDRITNEYIKPILLRVGFCANDNKYSAKGVKIEEIKSDCYALENKNEVKTLNTLELMGYLYCKGLLNVP